MRAHSVETLGELGYQVYEAANGAAALAMLNAHLQIQLLFTDVGLPGGMNGRQLADEARRQHPDLKVLFTTGYARNAIVHDGRLDPGVHLITKPFTYAALAGKLREILENTGAPPCVLVVDDEDFVRLMLREGLEDIGYCVEEAGTATEALNKYRLLVARIGAVVLDVGLPDRKGDAIALELRATNGRLPIIIASGYGETVLEGRLANDPGIVMLSKPYGVDELDAVLRNFGMAPSSPKQP